MSSMMLRLSAARFVLLTRTPVTMATRRAMSTSFWQSVKIPKGFENFFPKNSLPKKPKTSSNTAKNASDKQAPSGKTPKEDKNKPPHKKTKKAAFTESPFGNSNNANGANNGEPHPAVLLALLAAIVTGRSFLDSANHNSKEITYKDFYAMLEDGLIEKLVVINREVARVVLKDGVNHVALAKSSSPTNEATNADDWNDETSMEWGAQTSVQSSRQKSNSTAKAKPLYHFSIGSVEGLEDKLTRAQQELGLEAKDFIPVTYQQETDWLVQGIKLIPTIALVGLVAYAFKSQAGKAGAGGPGGIFQIGKSNAKRINQQDIKVNFSDVAGCQEAKKEIMEFVDFLQDSSRFTKLGAKIPKGALLCGPPGTGKTLLAKAVAGEAGVPFFSISGSDFIEMFVGVGPSRVRDLFKEARANAPCIVFIDEIDAVGRQRGRGGVGGNDERENTLNQLLVEMDGFQPSTGVVVLAGTNRVDILDQALTRPGRFDRQIQVDRPDLQGRKEIFKVHLRGIQLEDDVEDIAGRLAGLTPGFAGADIANICNEAAIVAARRKGESVSLDDFEKATDRIVGGLESNKIMSKEERSIVAHHEAGHAIAGWFLEHASPLLKVTIIPRSSGALGYAQYLPKETFLRTHDQIMDIVCMALAGRASEEIFFGRVTTGASDDLKKVTEMVYNMIQIYGMNTRLGQLAFPKDPNAMFDERPYSDATANAMDEEAKNIVDQAYQRTLNLLMERKDELTKVATMLLEKETITHDDVIDLIGPRPFKSDSQYDEYVSRRRKEEPIDSEPLTPGLA